MSRLFRVVVVSIAATILAASAAAGQELRVMISGGFAAAFVEAVPQFEKATGLTIVASFGASMGGAPDSIPSRLERGEPVDVVILAASALEDLIRQGKVQPGSRVDLVRSDIGMVVRAGARKPDIGSVGALRRTLLEAASVAYSASASGVYLSTELFQALGIADQMRSKGRRIESERVAAVVARGEAELGFQQISELLPVPGVDYVGPLPPEVQRTTIFSAGVATGVGHPEAARTFIDFLASETVEPIIRKTGLLPATGHR